MGTVGKSSFHPSGSKQKLRAERRKRVSVIFRLLIKFPGLPGDGQHNSEEGSAGSGKGNESRGTSVPVRPVSCFTSSLSP